MKPQTTTTEMKIGMVFPTRIGVFDTETTSPDPQQARIVSCFIGVMDTATGEFEEKWSWIVNPGVEIPTEASDIHGITTAEALARGMDAKTAIYEINQRIDILHKRSLAIVAMNAVYDFTVLDREVLRHWPGMRPNIEGVWEVTRAGTHGKWEVTLDPMGIDTTVGLYDIRWRITASPVIFDPMVLDRAFDKWRKGSRKLVDLAAFYGVPVELNAHDAEADCRMVGRVAAKIMTHSRLQDMSLSEVHDKIIPTKRNQIIGPDGLVNYWRKKAASTSNLEERRELLERASSAERTGHYWPLIPREIGES